MAKTLIIHGWSDCSESFKGIKDMLVRNKIATKEDIYFVDYESREDDLDFDEISRALHNRLKQRQLIADNGDKIEDLNVVVHSTGGLVLRDWIRKYYKDDPEKCPVRRVVMLAPANFGSPLAHRGKSFVGNLVKGRWKVGDFLEVGQQLLDGLELASPYQWNLAHHDLFGSHSPFSSDLIKCTVLVGGKDYEGLRGWINKPGTDGTVVIAGTHLNTTKLSIDYTQNRNGVAFKRPSVHQTTGAIQRSAFGVLAGLDHGSIVENATGKGLLTDLICKGLTLNDKEGFEELQNELAAVTEKTFDDSPAAPYQQFVFRCLDDDNSPVRDYNLEFFLIRKKKGNQFASGIVDLPPFVTPRPR